MLLAPRFTLQLAVMGAVEAKLVGELTVMVFIAPVPNMTFPAALKTLFALTVTGALAMTAAAKVAVARTLMLLVLLVPMVTLPNALSVLPAVMVTGAFAVMDAVEAKVVTAFTTRV